MPVDPDDGLGRVDPRADPRHRPRAVHHPGLRQDVAAPDRRTAGLHQGGDLLPLRQQGRHPDGAAPAPPRVRARGPRGHGGRRLGRVVGPAARRAHRPDAGQQRALFILHERNQAAIEDLHRQDHEGDHEDIQNRFRQALSNEDLPAEMRVRMACAIGAVMGALAFSGDVFSSFPSDELGDMLRARWSRLPVGPVGGLRGRIPPARRRSEVAGHPDAVVEPAAGSGRCHRRRDRHSHSVTASPMTPTTNRSRPSASRTGPSAAAAWANTPGPKMVTWRGPTNMPGTCTTMERWTAATATDARWTGPTQGHADAA